MKKVLLGTSAIALASAFATSAQAVDWEVKVGGYMEQFAAWSSPDVDGLVSDDYDGIDSKQDSEVHFLPSITLDNGLKIGANIQLEGFTDGADQIDESFLFIDGSFGRVLLGSENSAGYLMHYAAPDVSFLNVNSGSMTAFVPFSGSVVGETADFGIQNLTVGADVFRGTLGATYVENGRNNDAQRFTYFTPRFAGFQFGLSYARDPNQDNNAQQNLAVENANLNNITDFGANYVNSFGAFDVALSGRYGIAFLASDFNDDDDVIDFPDIGDLDDNPTVWSAGLNLGYAGFTIGGSFAEQNNTSCFNNSDNPLSGFGTNSALCMDGTAWDAGIAYETGPWGFSFTYFKGENVDNEAQLNGFAGADETLKQYLLAMNYDLAKGVAVGAYGAYVDFDEEVGDVIGIDAAGNDVFVNPGGDDVDGWVVGTGIKISF
jgi:predicted porin